LSGIEIEGVAEEEMRVDHRRQQIVRRRDGVEVAMEMQIDFLAGLDLGQTAARRAAFHSEHRPQRGFAGSEDRFLTDAFEALRQADGHHRFAFAGGGGRGGGNQDQLAVDRQIRVIE
jgi:hypothetical protein